MRNQISMVAGKGIYPLAPTAGDPSPESPGLAMAAGKRICFDASVVRGLGLRSPTEGDCNLHKLVGASTRAAVLWLPAVYRESHFAFRARGAATDAAAIRSPSKCSRGAAILTPQQVQRVGAEPLTARRRGALPHN